MDGVVRKMMNITDEMAATDAAASRATTRKQGPWRALLTSTRAASQQASSSTASCGRATHQTWCGMSQ
eukprot:540457-Pleurochrysis_carterae.AAC.1